MLRLSQRGARAPAERSRGQISKELTQMGNASQCRGTTPFSLPASASPGRSRWVPVPAGSPGARVFGLPPSGPSEVRGFR